MVGTPRSWTTMATEERFLIFPGLEIFLDGEEAAVRNQVMGYELAAPKELLKLLERLRLPRTARELGVSPETLVMLRRRYLIVAEDELAHLGPGVQQPVDRPLGAPLPLAELERADGVVFVGAPIDAGGGLGARKGPELIRRAYPIPARGDVPRRLLDYELRREVNMQSLNAWDLGDVPWFPDDGLETYGCRLKHVVLRLLEAGARPLVMGGDHSITPFILEAFFEHHPELHVVHFDAHTDLLATPGRDATLTHANAMLFPLRDHRLASLLQLGVRMLEPLRGHRSADERVSFLSARELYRCDPDSVFGHLPQGAPCYLTFDADVMSPFEAPNTGTPEIGGLSYYLAMDLFEALARRVDLVGADFVEVAATPGALTGTNTTALITARFMFQLVSGFAGHEPLEDYLPDLPGRRVRE